MRGTSWLYHGAVAGLATVMVACGGPASDRPRRNVPAAEEPRVLEAASPAELTRGLADALLRGNTDRRIAVCAAGEDLPPWWTDWVKEEEGRRPGRWLSLAELGIEGDPETVASQLSRSDFDGLLYVRAKGEGREWRLSATWRELATGAERHWTVNVRTGWDPDAQDRAWRRTATEGLPAGAVVQDACIRDGVVWIGTDKGLFHAQDGTHFTSAGEAPSASRRSMMFADTDGVYGHYDGAAGYGFRVGDPATKRAARGLLLPAALRRFFQVPEDPEGRALLVEPSASRPLELADLAVLRLDSGGVRLLFLAASGEVSFLRGDVMQTRPVPGLEDVRQIDGHGNHAVLLRRRAGSVEAGILDFTPAGPGEPVWLPAPPAGVDWVAAALDPDGHPVLVGSAAGRIELLRPAP